MSRRVVITGLGVVSPLGNTPDRLWAGLASGQSAVGPITSFQADAYPVPFAAEAKDFTGAIDDFGPLEKGMKRTINKGLKTMCREMQAGIAVSQLALNDSKLNLASIDRSRFGVVYGSDYMLTLPQEFASGIKKCIDEEGKFDFSRWAEKGLKEVEPLWLLKYLPNLPAAHVAIFNDLQGPNNSLTVREASGNMALGEAFRTIERGHAEIMLSGATGTKVNPMRTLHAETQEEVARGTDPHKLCRPFDLDRNGTVLGEGAAVFTLEEFEYAQARGARIYGEIIGHSSSTVASTTGKPDFHKAVKNVLEMALRDAKLQPADIDHVHAHGLGTKRADADEAQAIQQVLGKVPVVTAKGHFGNLGAGGGMVELVASLWAIEKGHLFPTLNYETPDPQCPVNVVTSTDIPAGDTFINVNFTPQGQASAIIVRKVA